MNTHPAPLSLLRDDIDPVDVLRLCGRTFFAASRILPPDVRHDLAVLYAFCRLVDDCGDAVSREEAYALLDEVEQCLDSRRDTSPIVRAFRDLADRHDIPLIYAQQLIEGVRSDLSPVRVESSSQLVRYAYSVASTVGLMMCRVLNVPRVGDPFAIDLGIAMQLTNIARDVREDAINDRIYLPAEWVAHESVLNVQQNPAPVVAGVERALKLADRYYASAERGMRYLPLSVRPGIRAAAINYRAIGGVIRTDPVRALQQRVATGGVSKAVRMVFAAGLAFADSIPATGSPSHNDDLHAALQTRFNGVAVS